MKSQREQPLLDDEIVERLDEEEREQKANKRKEEEKKQAVMPPARQPEKKARKKSEKTRRQEAFKKNLAVAMLTRRIGEESLIITCGFDGEGRKWLQRVIRHGLDRRNQNSEAKLTKLCEVLKTTPAWLWNDDPKREVAWTFFVLWGDITRPDSPRKNDQMAEHIEKQVMVWKAAVYGKEKPQN